MREPASFKQVIISPLTVRAEGGAEPQGGVKQTVRTEGGSAALHKVKGQSNVVGGTRGESNQQGEATTKSDVRGIARSRNDVCGIVRRRSKDRRPTRNASGTHGAGWAGQRVTHRPYLGIPLDSDLGIDSGLDMTET